MIVIVTGCNVCPAGMVTLEGTRDPGGIGGSESHRQVVPGRMG